MDAPGQVGCDIADHRCFDRARVADDGARRQTGSHRLGEGRVGANRRTQDDQIGALDGGARVRLGTLDEAQLKCLGAGLLAPRAGDDLAHQTLALGDAGDGRADQPDADQGEPLEKGISRHRRAP